MNLGAATGAAPPKTSPPDSSAWAVCGALVVVLAASFLELAQALKASVAAAAAAAVHTRALIAKLRSGFFAAFLRLTIVTILSVSYVLVFRY